MGYASFGFDSFWFDNSSSFHIAHFNILFPPNKPFLLDKFWYSTSSYCLFYYLNNNNNNNIGATYQMLII